MTSDEVQDGGLAEVFALSQCFLVVVVVVMTSPSGTAYMGDKNVPKRRGNPPDSKSGGIRLSLVIIDSHLLTGAPLVGGCRCPQLMDCQPLSNDRRRRMSTNCQAVVGSPTL